MEPLALQHLAEHSFSPHSPFLSPEYYKNLLFSIEIEDLNFVRQVPR